MDRPVGYNTAKGAYVVSVAEGTSKLPIRIKANSPFAKVAVDRFANPLGSDGASYSDNNEIMLPGYDISGTDLNKGLEIPFYVKAENGAIRTYKIIVQTAARDTAVTKVTELQEKLLSISSIRLSTISLSEETFRKLISG